jgi:hypothetical protein
MNVPHVSRRGWKEKTRESALSLWNSSISRRFVLVLRIDVSAPIALFARHMLVNSPVVVLSQTSLN